MPSEHHYQSHQMGATSILLPVPLLQPTLPLPLPGIERYFTQKGPSLRNIFSYASGPPPPTFFCDSRSDLHFGFKKSIDDPCRTLMERKSFDSCVLGGTRMLLTGKSRRSFQIDNWKWEPGRGKQRSLISEFESGGSETALARLRMIKQHFM
ncbi:hypothetical protein BJ742DRAFT_310603 [Cladochytrium replicatum]|nr:hypothetical protein BJ742DRAFT_310603 [Cladochytrium replicatum]